MRVDVNNTSLKILDAIKQLTNLRKENKKIYINSFSISKISGLKWDTVDKYLKRGII